MKNLIQTLLVFLALGCAPFAQAQANPTSEAVTVVIQINLQPGAQAQAAMAPMNDMRTLIRKQAGYLGGESLQNNNPSNAPAFVHVTRWTALKYWENVYKSPEFSKLNVAGIEYYQVKVSAFKTLQ